MKAAAQKLNLKGHMAGIYPTREIFGPGDIEGHAGEDGRYYVLDFARLFPPEHFMPDFACAKEFPIQNYLKFK